MYTVPRTARSAHNKALKDLRMVKARAEYMHTLAEVSPDDTQRLIQDFMQAQMQVKLTREQLKQEKKQNDASAVS